MTPDAHALGAQPEDTSSCRLCAGACTGADLRPLLVPELRWFFELLAAAADRRGDEHLTGGFLAVRVCQDAAGRAALRGLLGGRELRPGQTTRVDLGELTVVLRARAPKLTPGSVTAHVTGRPLALASKKRSAQAERAAALKARYLRWHTELQATTNDAPTNGAAIDSATTGRAYLDSAILGADPGPVWERLRTAGHVTRLRDAPDGMAVLEHALTVLQLLARGGHSIDRRVLAQTATGDPHSLDAGGAVAGAALGLLTAAGVLPAGLRGRAGWEALGVFGDDALGGLLAVGLAPVGWSVPTGTLLGLTPRELARLAWPAPPHPGSWVFVTENPSVATAAADHAATTPLAPLLCTSGTPSALEVAAVARLEAAGWRVAVRADFDRAGLGHVRAVLAAAPGAVPWRMDSASYEQSLTTGSAPAGGAGAVAKSAALVPDEAAPWDGTLAPAMRRHGAPAYEEALLEALLADLAAGSPAR